MLLFVGCNKQRNLYPETLPNLKEFKVPDLLSKSTPFQNEGDEKISQVLQEVHQAFSKTILDLDFRKNLLVELASNSNNEIELSKITSFYPNFMNMLSKETKESHNASGDELLKGMMYNGIPYYPVVYAPNAKKVDSNSAYSIVALGVELVEPEDAIPAIKITQQGEFELLALTEEMANDAAVPVFIITAGTDYVDYDLLGTGPEFTQTVTIIDGRGEGASRTGEKEFEWSQAQIKGITYRYEGSGKSELHSTCTLFDENGNPYSTDPSAFYYTADRKEVREFSKSEIENSQSFNISSDIFSNNNNEIITTVYDTDHYLLSHTFEYDWYASLKVMPNGANGGTSSCANTFQTHKARMKYANEWYNYIEVSCPGGDVLDLESLNLNSTF